jgi:hypothetical protein
MGQGTTEIGVSRVFSKQIDVSAGEKGLVIENRHAIIWETFDDHLHPKAQAGKIAIDDVESKTYPRWNFRGGPNTTKKVDYCTSTELKGKKGFHQYLSISVDSEFIYWPNMAWWIKHQIPSTPEFSLGTGTPTNPRHYLVKLADCVHEKHGFKARPRGVDGRLIYTNVLTRSQKKAAAWAKIEYSM